ncbi:MAG: LOG family protein, partial [Candidatus Nanopelagicales bacterium]|nr:LOG family protein [Candidatus Nanopelagicales bacterium]
PARKTCLIDACDAVMVFAGGFGTLDELFEVLTLVQTRKMHPIPVILVDRRYWSGLIDWIESTVLTQGCVSEHDLDLVHVVDTAEEAVAICNQSVPVPRDELRRG